jgi:molybdopterin-guanine dinucleotide biosynthesis protein A
MTGAILAGGMSTRMGQDKASLRLRDGRTMLHRMVRVMGELCEPVVIVGPHIPGDTDHHVHVDDLRKHCGPLGGIEALLASGIDPQGQYLICPCDLPLITAVILRMLMESGGRPATAFHLEGTPAQSIESLPARISADALPAVRRLLDAGQRSIWKLMEELRPNVVTLDADLARRLHNVNTPDDLREMNEG